MAIEHRNASTSKGFWWQSESRAGLMSAVTTSSRNVPAANAASVSCTSYRGIRVRCRFCLLPSLRLTATVRPESGCEGTSKDPTLPITDYQTCTTIEEATAILGHEPGTRTRDRGSTRKKKSSSRQSTSSSQRGSISTPLQLFSDEQGLGGFQNVAQQPLPEFNSQAFLFDDNLNGGGRLESNPILRNYIPVQQWTAQGTSPNLQYSAYVPGGGSDGCGCSSSESCHCYGCATHPDNPRTMSHVNNVMRMFSQANLQDAFFSDSMPPTPGTYAFPGSAPNSGTPVNTAPFDTTLQTGLASPTSPTASGQTDDFSCCEGNLLNNSSASTSEAPAVMYPPTPQSLPHSSIDLGRTPSWGGGIPYYSPSCQGQHPLCRCHVCLCNGCINHVGCNATAPWGLPSSNPSAQNG